MSDTDLKDLEARIASRIDRMEVTSANRDGTVATHGNMLVELSQRVHMLEKSKRLPIPTDTTSEADGLRAECARLGRILEEVKEHRREAENARDDQANMLTDARIENERLQAKLRTAGEKFWEACTARDEKDEPFQRMKAERDFARAERQDMEQAKVAALAGWKMVQQEVERMQVEIEHLRGVIHEISNIAIEVGG